MGNRLCSTATPEPQQQQPQQQPQEYDKSPSPQAHRSLVHVASRTEPGESSQPKQTHPPSLSSATHPPSAPAAAAPSSHHSTPASAPHFPDAYRRRAPSHSRVSSHSSHSLPSPLLLPALPALTLPLPPSLSARATPQSGQPQSPPRQLSSYHEPPPSLPQQSSKPTQVEAPAAEAKDNAEAATRAPAAPDAPDADADADIHASIHMNVSPIRAGESKDPSFATSKRAESHEVKQPESRSSSLKPEAHPAQPTPPSSMLRTEGDVKQEQRDAFSGQPSHEHAARTSPHAGQPKQLHSTPEELQAAIKRGAAEASPEEEQQVERGKAYLGDEDKSRAYPQLSQYASPAQAAREHVLAGSGPAKAGADDEAAKSGKTIGQTHKQKEGSAAEAKGSHSRAGSQSLQGEEGWTMVDRPPLMGKVSQQIVELWNTKMLPTVRKAGTSIMAASDKAMQQVKSSMEHPTTQSVWQDCTVMFGQVRSKYSGSVQCMLRDVKAMSLEELAPLAALFVLHWLVPLTYIYFHEARTVLKYALFSYVIMHALFHFSKMSLRDCIHVSHLAFVPMLFSLWMQTGAEGLMVAHLGWLQLVHARPVDMHLFLLWLRATMMCTFAILCSDVRVLLSWQAAKGAAGSGVGVGNGVSGASAGAVPSGVSAGGHPAGASAAAPGPPASSSPPAAPVDVSQTRGQVHVQVDLPQMQARPAPSADSKPTQGMTGPSALDTSP